MKKTVLVLFVLLSFVSIAFSSPPEMGDEGTIHVHNSILAKINDESISVMDIKKRLDMAFYRNYPNLATSTQARLQFYQTQWKAALAEMIDQQLMLADAEDKKVPLSDGEVREEMEQRFGPNIMLTLDKMDLTYDEAWKIVKNDLIVQRMSWWFVHAKAMNQITPHDIKQAYRAYLKDHPAFSEWKYRVIAVRGNTPQETADKVYKILVERKESLGPWVEEIDPAVQLSAEFVAEDKKLSDAHRQVLLQLQPGEFSRPTVQQSKVDQQFVARIFYLQDKIAHEAPSFDTLSNELRNQLVQRAAAEESSSYMQKLRKTHTFFDNAPDNLQPFSIQ